MAVFVLSMTGEPLMPTVRYGKVRHLLKEKKARVAGRHPFTIQLLYETTSFTQPVEFCEDTGSHYIGISVKSEKREYLSMEVQTLPDEKERHDDARQHRRARRSRKRYRKPRFDNRKRKKGWLPPSLEHKKDIHLYWFEKLLAVCPVTHGVFETGHFDTQLLHAIEAGESVPEGKDYQHGPKYRLATLREAVFVRDRYTCAVCGKSVGDGAVLHAHHALYWKGRHGNQVRELLTVCGNCHTPANHQEGGALWGITPKGFVEQKGMAVMNALRWKILEGARAIAGDIKISNAYGAETKAVCQFLGTPKSHVNDAWAMGSFHPEERAEVIYLKKKRRNNRILEKFYDARYTDIRDGKVKSGKELSSGRGRRNKDLNGENCRVYRGEKKKKGRRSIRRARYPLRPGDVVRYDGRRYTVSGCHNYGRYVVLQGVKKSVPVKKDELKKAQEKM